MLFKRFCPSSIFHPSLEPFSLLSELGDLWLCWSTLIQSTVFYITFEV